MGQGLQNQAKELSELKNQMGEIVEFMGQIQEQSEFSNSTIENSVGDFEITEATTLESGMEVGDEPKTSKTCHNMDEQLLFEEEEEDKAKASLEEALPQQPKDPTPPTLGKVVLYSILSDPVTPNVPIPCRFNEEEGEKGIVETFPTIQEKEVVGDYLELIKEDVLATTIPNEVEFYDTGQVLQTPNLAEISNLQSFEVVFVLEFVIEHKGKPPPRISISFYTNMLLMIQAPTLEFKPLPDHFNYHLPFKDKGEVSSG